MDPELVFLSIWCILVLLSGFFMPFISEIKKARGISWCIAIITSIISITFTTKEPPLARMLIITSLQLFAMKGIVMVETYRGKPNLRFFQWVFFALAWFGMRPTPFETLSSNPQNNWFAFILKGLLRILLGTILLYVASIFTFNYIQNLLFLIGLSLILHFGILNVSTGIWRSLGVDTKELFVAPYKSKSLKEFWGRRWNQAFSEMTALAVYKPLVGKYGKSWAMILSFLFSGVLHEIAISFPVDSGYGLPMLYFVLHAILMIGESKITIFKKITSHPVLSHVWVLCWLILPLPLLFHQSFLTEVVKPLAGYILQISN